MHFRNIFSGFATFLYLGPGGGVELVGGDYQPYFPMPQTVSGTYPKHSSVLQRISEIELSKVVPQNKQIRKKKLKLLLGFDFSIRLRTQLFYVEN